MTIPGPVAWVPKPNVSRGAVTRHAYHSEVAGGDRDYFVYTPPGYDAKREEACPVLYLLHGLGDDAQSWLTQGNTNLVLDNLIAEGKAQPMIMVNPLGYGSAGGGQGPPDMLTFSAETLLEEVMPRVEARYNVANDREHRAIAGLSMGGAEATYTGLNHLDKFAWISSFSSAYVMWPGANAPRGGGPPPAGTLGAAAPAGGRGGASRTLDASIIEHNFGILTPKVNSQIRLLWIACGTADGLIGVNRQFKDWLKARDVKFTESEIPDVGHVWPLWRQNLTDLAPRLFQTGGK